MSDSCHPERSRGIERAIQWYPGHMVRAMRKIGEYVALIDIVLEVVDARVPESGRNPMLDGLVKRRPRIVVLNREDLADPHATKAWIADFAARNLRAVAVDGRNERSVARVARATTALASSLNGISRAMVVGLPNSGKSSIINRLIKRAAAKTEDRAGVTRQLQWFKLPPNVEIMDTPGILVPKIPDADAQWKLAICGAVPRERYEPEEVAIAFHRWLVAHRPRTRVPDLETFAGERGFKRRGGEIDYHNAAQSYIAAINDGTFGRISFESPDDAKAA